MFLPQTFGQALILTILSAVFWGSWANSYKGTKSYPFALFYWDYIFGFLLCAVAIALTLGSHGIAGEPFLANLATAEGSNLVFALMAGVVFNIANVLLVAALDIAGLSIAFPIAIGIAVVEGVVVSYALQPKGSLPFLAGGLVLALCAVILNARAYASIGGAAACGNKPKRSGVGISIVSGLLMGVFAPLVTRALTYGHAMTPYSVSVLFAVGALLCCIIFNTYLMRRPIEGPVVSFREYAQAGSRNHLLGIIGGIAWGFGGCFNFIAAGYVGVPISYAIGQSAPLIAAAWGVFVWREFSGAPRQAWTMLGLMAACYLAAIGLIALAYHG
ncbi:GRP family sugar transporter [Sphingomonas bacterium]|uniref:GRP family sugar transporter n=1 Tax=Sphingomonas bacterium TaxID=1895847 RepID=UPI001575250A|nr:GRP family sugar transporter [Sphingomonas bacterium]